MEVVSLYLRLAKDGDFGGLAGIRPAEPLGRATSTARVRPPPGGRIAESAKPYVFGGLGAINCQTEP